MPLNIEAVNKTIEVIKSSNPDKFRMGDFFSRDFEIMKDNPDPDEICFTAACIGGWVVIGNVEPAETINIINCGDIDSIAGDLLGLSRTQRWQLFYLYEGYKANNIILYKALLNLLPPERRDSSTAKDNLSMFDALPAEVRHQIGIYVLEHLRDTGNVSWLHAVKRYSERNEDDTAPAQTA